MAEGCTHALPPAMQGKEKYGCHNLAETSVFCTKHGFKMGSISAFS